FSRGRGPLRPITRSAVAIPAQLIAPCKPPNSRAAVSTALCTCAPSVTSVRAKRTEAPNSGASCAPRSLTSQITTLAPAPASSATQAAPSPELPPLTKNVRPSNCIAAVVQPREGDILDRG